MHNNIKTTNLSNISISKKPHRPVVLIFEKWSTLYTLVSKQQRWPSSTLRIHFNMQAHTQEGQRTETDLSHCSECLKHSFILREKGTKGVLESSIREAICKCYGKIKKAGERHTNMNVQPIPKIFRNSLVNLREFLPSPVTNPKQKPKTTHYGNRNFKVKLGVQPNSAFDPSIIFYQI